MKGKIVLFLLFLLGISLWADNYFPEKQVYYIEQIERDDGELSFDFAVPIDPASVTSESIYVNDEPLPADIKIYFNRRGDEMKIPSRQICCRVLFFEYGWSRQER